MLYFLVLMPNVKYPLKNPAPPCSSCSQEKVIIGKNEVFKVADHDFSKLSIIPDAVLVHDIPENYEHTTEDESEKELISSSKSSKGDWYAGKVYYSFKSIVLEGSTSCGVTEMGNVLENVYVDNETILPPQRWRR